MSVEGTRGEEGNGASSCEVEEAGGDKSDEASLGAYADAHASSKDQAVGKDCDEIGDRQF